MKVYVYPADVYGCGSFRLIWPVQYLREQGYDVVIMEPERRDIELRMSGDRVVSVKIPSDADVMVFQRVTHALLVQALDHIRRQGVAVVVDIDDDLTRIHPSNPAWSQLVPRNEGQLNTAKGVHQHSWHHLTTVCQNATMVTVSTPALIRRYAAHGRGRVLENCLPDVYYEQPAHEDSEMIAWPASLHSHPNDPQTVGHAVSRLINDGVNVQIFGDTLGTGRAFGLSRDLPGTGAIDFDDWPTVLHKIGIGITPLADTTFNRAKSWVKPLELAASGAPWVGSPRAEYQRLHDQGTGVLVDRPKDWYRILRSLSNEAEWRADLSAAGREVAERWKLRDHAWRWWEAWSDALDIERDNRKTTRHAQTPDHAPAGAT